jgi:peptidoglycan biosynthesis protein MviN/MurJ (putative lipid II flippase)
MDLRRLRAGEWIAAASGTVLLLALFLPWYTADAEHSTTGWESFAVLDIVLALIAASAVALLLVTATQPVPAVPVALAALVAIAGFVATVLVLIRVLELPEGAAGREWALWLGLAGSLGVLTGGLLATRDERLSPPGRHTDITGRPAPPPPEIEAIPAPRREGPA